MRTSLLVLLCVLVSSTGFAQNLQVIPVPVVSGGAGIPHAAYNGHPTTLKAIARGGNGSYLVEWDYEGDGTYDTGATRTNRYDLSVAVQYPNQARDVKVTARVRVTSNGQTVVASYPVHVYADVPVNPASATDRQLQVMRDVAVDDGLWFLHNQLARSGNEADALFGAQATGRLTYNSNLNTALALEAFGRAQHYPAFPAAYTGSMPNPQQNDTRWNTDPYAEDSMRMVNYLLTQAGVASVQAQDESNLTGFYPEVTAAPIAGTDDGIGLFIGDSPSSQLIGPWAVSIAAFATARLTGYVAQVGDSNRILGRRFEFVVQQLVDGLVWAQADSTFPGSWYYFPNATNDMLGEFESGMSGPVHAFQAVELYMSGSGVIVPNLVKARAASYLQQNVNACPQGGTGGTYSSAANGVCDFALSATHLFTWGWLGANTFSAGDTRLAFPSYNGLTRGQLRAWHDSSLVFITNVFVSTSTGQNNWDTGFVTAGDFSRTDGQGNLFSMKEWAKAARAVKPNVPAFGPHPYARLFSQYLINNQIADGSWRWTFGTTQPNTDNFYGVTGRQSEALVVLLGDAPEPVTSLLATQTTAQEGAPLTFEGVANLPGTTTWRVNGVARGTGSSFITAFPDDGTYTVSFELLTAEGALASSTVNVTVTNANPVVDAGSELTVDEGTAVNLVGTVTDPGSADTHVSGWQFGDGATGPQVATHAWADDGTYTATFSTTDDDLGTASAAITVRVRNVAPVITSRPALSGAAGTAWTYTMTFNDPGTTDTHVCSMPSAPAGAIRTGCAVSWTPAASPASGAFSLCVTDDDGAATCESFTVTVPLVDTDSDTLPDGWEIATFGDLTHGPTEDTDADGLSVRDEWLAGTSPTQFDGPSAPTASACGATVTNARPTLTVTNASDPQLTPLRYEFELYEDQALTRLLLVEREVPAGSTSTSWRVSSPLDEDQRYFWRARARDASVFGAWTATCSFTVNATNARPAAPRLFSPAVGATVNSVPVNLVVTNATDSEGDALTYEFEVFLDGERGASVTSLAEGASTTSWATSGLGENSTFTWRARASDAGGPGPWSELGRFSINVLNTPPTQPVPLSPREGSTVTTSTPTLEFLSLGDPDGDSLRFDWELAADDSFNLVLASEADMRTTSRTLTTALEEDSRACWRVRADDGQSTSEWVSSCFRVSVSDDAPNVPTTGNPSKGSVVATLTPVFSWAPARDPEGLPVFYDLEVTESGTLVASVTRISGSAALVPEPLVDGKSYTWRVRSVTDEGPASAFSGESLFEVKVPAAAQPAKGCSTTAGSLALLGLLGWFGARRRRGSYERP